MSSEASKVFISLQLPPSCQREVAKSAQYITLNQGVNVQEPVKEKSYHITIGVMHVEEKDLALVEKHVEDMQRSIDNMTKTVLSFPECRRFGKGAVYLRLSDMENSDSLKRLREDLEEFCAARSIYLLPLETFHITLFKSNTAHEDCIHYLPPDFAVLPFGNKEGPAPATHLQRKEQLDAITQVSLRHVKRYKGRDN